ncbi:MAG: phosphomannomutase/phosphoglucomutase [Deltaproteobacteria bacterium]|nr:phosphomannomutase/phosphoglucomutase [Deltaproteobacteria bacterium]
MNPAVFREYDVRGLVENDLHENFVYNLGRAIGTLAGGQGIMSIGRDCRLSSAKLAAVLADGLMASGITIVDIGLCATPMLYFSIHQLKLDGGVMVTGSHNPPEFNGFKICIGKETIHGEKIQQLYQIMLAESFHQGRGGRSATSVTNAYATRLLSDIQIRKGIKVAVDSGNGVGGIFLLPLLKECGCEVLDLYCTPDGSFPNHFPDPTVAENLSDLISLVKKEKAELGIAFDGDADRIGAITDNGDIVWGDLLLALFARDILRKNHGATIIGEVKCSNRLYDAIALSGGKGIMWKAGHSLIKEKMKETGALLAGEMSGHMFFADRYYGYDDAIYAALRLLEVISREEKPLSQIMSVFPPSFSTPEIRIECPDAKKFAVVEEVKTILAKSYETNTIDGVRIASKEGWGLLRASNTQPVLVLRFESDSQAGLTKIRSVVEETLKMVMG